MAELKNPIVAAILSFLVPGWGQVYNGQGYLKGLLFLIGELVGLLFLIVPGLVVWVYGIYRAYKVADSINKGLMPEGKKVTIVGHILYLVLYFVVVFAFVLVLVIVGLLIAMVFSISTSTITPGPEMYPY